MLECAYIFGRLIRYPQIPHLYLARQKKSWHMIAAHTVVSGIITVMMIRMLHSYNIEQHDVSHWSKLFMPWTHVFCCT